MDEHGRVIVVGTSAGGVDALLRMAPALSKELEAPVLVVLHIGAHRSYLPELLNARAGTRAVFAEAGMVPRPGHLYVAPPDTHLLLDGGRLQLFRGPKENHARPAINPLFRSAALDGGARIIGVILTGTLDDGAAGLHAVKACGGMAIVQDPADAAESSMPRSALAATAVDHVATLAGMPALLERLARTPPVVPSPPAPPWLRMEHAIFLGQKKMADLATIGDPSGFTCPDCGGALFELMEGGPARYLCHTGHGFSLHSLASAQGEMTEEALWAALRALQEKEGILRRLAVAQADERPGSDAASLAEADGLKALIDRLRSLVTTTPADSTDP